MSIYVNAESRVLVQGITGSEGMFHTGEMLACGTRVVAGVPPPWPPTRRWRPRTRASRLSCA